MMSVFEKITRTAARDAFEDNAATMTFIVNEGQLFKALGKAALNIRRLEKILKKKVRVIEFAPELEKFIINAIHPNKCDIKIGGDIVTLLPNTLKMRGNLIGRAASHLRNTEMIVQRYFPIKRIVVTNVQEKY